MMRKPVPVVLVALVAAAVGGCKFSAEPATSGSVSETSVAPLVPQRPFPIADLPIPLGFHLDAKSVNSDSPGGMRFVDHLYKGREDKVAVRQFYVAQMPEHGWKMASNQLTQGTFFLTYQKGIERCNLSIGDGGWFNTVEIRARIYAVGSPETPAEPQDKRSRKQ